LKPEISTLENSCFGEALNPGSQSILAFMI
jgi:hypothetical protein